MGKLQELARSAALWYGPDPIDDDAPRDFPALLVDLLGEPAAYEKLRGLSVIPGARSVAQAESNAGAGAVPALGKTFDAGVHEIYDECFRAAIHHRW